MAEPKNKVLVIEDEPSLQEAARLKLEREGIEVFSASTGEDGLKLLKEKKPDLLWLDILLPGMNGLEVLRQVRENPETKALPVIILSVSSGPDKIKQAFGLGVVDYMVKSQYTLEDVVKKVKEVLGSLS